MPFVRNLGKTNCITHIPEDIKLELYPLNAAITGSLTNSVGVVSGFSTSNYLTLPEVFNPEDKNWEIVISLTTGSTVTDTSYNQVFYTAGYNSSKRVIWAYIERGTGIFSIGLGSGGSEWVSYLTGTTALKPNTHYIVKITRNGNIYTSYLSSDNGETYNKENSIEISFSIPSYTPYLGTYVNTTNNYSFLGSINLAESYIKISEETWWKGGTGAVTLKAGSKLYVPNGFEEDGVTPKFEIVLTDKDISNSGQDWATNSGLVYYNYDTGNLLIHPNNYSGTTVPTSTKYSTWYDTSSNTIKISPDTGVTWKYLYSLPFAAISWVKSGSYDIVTSVDQVFNGFGYIGSTVFALPNVKGLIPDGWNEDGTLKSIERTNDSLLIVDTSSYITENHTWEFFISFQKNYRNSYRHFEQAVQPINIQSTTATWFNTSENLIYITNDSGATWSKADLCQAFKYTQLADGRVTLFTPKSVGGKSRTKLYQLMKPKRTYYKYGKESDVTKVGSFGNITDGVANGFSVSNYVQVPNSFKPETSPWEFTTKFNFGGSQLDIWRLFVTDNSANDRGFLLGGNTSNKFMIWVSSNGSDWNIASQASGTLVIDKNKDYWIKCGWDGSQYYVKYSTDGIEYITDISVASTKAMYHATGLFTIGSNISEKTISSTTSVDLKQSSIKINGELWWDGSDYNKFGSWIDDGVASGFSKDIYLKSPTTFTPSNKSWEVGFKITTGSSYSVFNDICGWKGSASYTAVAIGISNSTKILHVSIGDGSNTSAWVCAVKTSFALEDNTTYWFRVKYTGSQCFIEYSTNGKDYFKDSSIDVVLSLPSGDFLWGKYNSASSNYFSGSIDLSESYVKLDGKTWHYCTKAVQSTKDDYVYYTDKLLSYSPVLKTGKHFVNLFETATAGTYSVNIPKDTTARIAIVGGGGAAAMRGVYDDKGYGWGGGSGGAFVGTFALKAGTYSVTVGSANNNTTAQSGNSQTLNPSDTSTHDSYITGVVRVGGGGSGHYNSNYVGAAGAAPTFTIQPLTTTLSTAGKAGSSGSGGKGSAAAATVNGGASVYKDYGKGQGCKTSEYASKRSWINGTGGYVKIEIYSETENKFY